MHAPNKLPVYKALKKETIGESYKNLCKLLKGRSSDDFDNVEDLIKPSDPISRFEETLQLIVIDSLQLKEETLNILLSQNNYSIKRVLNFTWFFKNALEPEKYLNEIFPSVSTSLKYKLISRLSKSIDDEKIAEKFISLMQKDFPNEYLELFLPKCSTSFILHYINDIKPVFHFKKSSKILLLISRRYPSVAIKIFSCLITRENPVNISHHKKALIYLASNHSDVFIPFFSVYYSKLLFLRFGKVLSLILGLKLKDLVLNSVELLKSAVFNKVGLFKALDFNERVNYLSLVITTSANNEQSVKFSNWRNHTELMLSLLKLVQPTCRLLMIESVFKKVYNLSLMSCIKRCEPRLFEIVPLEARVPYIKAYQSAIMGEPFEDTENFSYDDRDPSKIWAEPVTYIYLYEFDFAFKRLKEILGKASTVDLREEIALLMIKNCTVNHDVTNLTTVVDYIRNRFRNDDPRITLDFLRTVFISFPLKILTTEIIEKIEEIVLVFFLKNEKYNFGYLMEKCIIHRLSENRNVDSQVKSVVDYLVETYGSDVLMRSYGFKFARQLFFKYYNELIERFATKPINGRLQDSIRILVLDAMKRFNKVQKENQINFSDINELIPITIEKAKKPYQSVLNDVDLSFLLDKKYLHILFGNYDGKLLKFLIRNYPQIIVNRLDAFIDFILLDTYRYHFECFRQALPLFSFEELTDKVKGLLLNQFHNGKSIAIKKAALKYFSFMCNMDELREVVDPFLPSSEQIDPKAKSDFVKIQLLIPSIIKNVKPSWMNLNFILDKFFIGDYLKYVLTSFYKSCYHMRSDHLIPELMKYLQKTENNRRVAIRKEVVRMLLVAVPFKDLPEMAQNFWEANQHHSVRGLIFNVVKRQFLGKPTLELFNLLKKFVGECDDTVIELRPNLREMPREFFWYYFNAVWEFSEKGRFENKKFEKDLQNSLLNETEVSRVNLLPTDFSEKIIKENLFQTSGLNVTSFTINYLMFDPRLVTSKLDFILDLLKNSTADSVPFITALRASFSNFASSNTLVDALLQKWPYKLTVVFDQFLVFNFYSIYYRVKSGSTSVDDLSRKFGKEIKKYFCSFDNRESLLPVFLDAFVIFTKEVNSKKAEVNVIPALREVITDVREISLAIFCILALPSNFTAFYKAEEKTFDSVELRKRKEVDEIVNILKNFQSDIVEIYFRRKFGFRKSEYALLKN